MISPSGTRCRLTSPSLTLRRLLVSSVCKLNCVPRTSRFADEVRTAIGERFGCGMTSANKLPRRRCSSLRFCSLIVSSDSPESVTAEPSLKRNTTHESAVSSSIVPPDNLSPTARSRTTSPSFPVQRIDPCNSEIDPIVVGPRNIHVTPLIISTKTAAVATSCQRLAGHIDCAVCSGDFWGNPLPLESKLASAMAMSSSADIRFNSWR